MMNNYFQSCFLAAWPQPPTVYLGLEQPASALPRLASPRPCQFCLGLVKTPSFTSLQERTREEKVQVQGCE